MKLKSSQVCLCALTIVVSAISVLSQNPDANALRRLANLNKELVNGTAGKLSTRETAHFRKAARERYEILSRLVESSPEEVLRYKLVLSDAAEVPSKTAGFFERQVQLTGEFEVIAECEENNFKIERFIKTAEGKVPLYFQDPPDYRSGATLSLSGISIDGKIAVESYSSAEAELLPNTTGEKKVLVILVNFQDKQTQPYTLERASDVTFNTASNFFRENSYGQTWLAGDVFGWYTIPVSSTVCDKDAIATYAQQAATRAGANLSSYTNIVYGFPSNACTFSGSSTVGGNPAQSWVKGDWFGIEVLGHELGHNFGLFHSRSIDCGNEVISGICTTNEYGDKFDLMGPGVPYHYNAYQKERLGWLNSGASPAIQDVTSNGIYNIEPYETPGSGPKGLKILRSVDPVSGARTWYYLEHRTPTGFDSGMSPYNLQNGILLHTATEGDGQDNYLLDMTPLTASWYDPALAQGQSYTDAELGLTITVISADNAGATVQIQLAAQACVRAIPTVTVTPGRSSWVQPGGTFNYQVSVRNNNSGGCSNEQFSLASNMPAGLSGAFSNGSLTLENGASGGTGLYVSSIPTAADGVYNFGVSATNGVNAAMSSSASAQQVLLSRLGVSAVAGAARYSRTQTVTVTSIVTAAGSPVGNATVAFTMTSLDGRPVRQTAVTAADGRAVFSYRLDRKRDLAGTYSVSSVASLNGFAGQATTSFVVK